MVELEDMRLFVQAIDAGSLSAAGRVLGLSAAVASKRLTRLESHLGIRLVQRTSRQLRLTEAGEIYYARCRDILLAAEDAEHAATQGRNYVSGTLRISAPVALGRKWLGPALAQFAEQHPHLQIHFTLDDAINDLIAEGLDCAVRVGGLRDSRLVTRKLAENYRVICAAPKYIQRYGCPLHPEELAHHGAGSSRRRGEPCISQ
jgi:DNA-binding transcriptional LysR family regulator